MCKFQNILFLCSFFGVCICDVTKSNMMETPQTQMTGGKIRITWEQMCKYMCFGHTSIKHQLLQVSAATAGKLLQSCPTLCNPTDGSPSGSPVPGILQSRTLEWVAISFSNAWKWKGKVKSLSHVQLFVTPWAAAYQAPLSMGFSRQEYWSGVPLPSPGTKN